MSYWSDKKVIFYNRTHHWEDSQTNQAIEVIAFGTFELMERDQYGNLSFSQTEYISQDITIEENSSYSIPVNESKVISVELPRDASLEYIFNISEGFCDFTVYKEENYTLLITNRSAHPFISKKGVNLGKRPKLFENNRQGLNSQSEV